MMIYIGSIKPFDQALMNYTELFNEICYIAIIYHLFLFTDFMPDANQQYNAGWSIIMITLLNILVNMSIIQVLAIIKIKSLIAKLKQFIIKLLKRD
jgi:hypothetical protein